MKEDSEKMKSRLTKQAVSCLFIICAALAGVKAQAAPAATGGGAGTKPKSGQVQSKALSKSGNGKAAVASKAVLKTGSQSAPSPKPASQSLQAGTQKASTTAQAKGMPRAAAAVGKNAKLVWLDMKSARQAASSSKKLILADFFTESCTWCKAMDRRTFSNEKVQNFLAANFVCMKVNAGDAADGQSLARRHQIEGFPTFCVFSASGRMFAKIEGFREADMFISELEVILARLKTKA